MVAVAGLLLPVIGWQGTKDPQAAGHNQGAVDLGGHSPVGLQVHAPRVPRPHRPESPQGLEGVRADRLHGGGVR